MSHMDGVTRTGLGVLDAEADLNWHIVGTVTSPATASRTLSGATR